MRDLLGLLSDGDRGLIERHYFDGCPLTELAQEMGVSYGPLRRRLQEILLELRRQLEGDEEPDIPAC
jgi:DNA-directed RNA polymerase specialized sigma24 family protein